MKVLSYKYIAPNTEGVVEVLDRQGYMTPQYINLIIDYLDEIELVGKCAFLYAAGAAVTASEARNADDKGIYREKEKKSSVVIKELAAYGMHKWIGMINGRTNIRYANVNANTCASSMYSLYEASKLLADGFDMVMIVAEEKTSYNTLRIFDEHSIDIKVGEGLAVIVLGRASSQADEDITDCKWEYEYNRNPFGVTSTGYESVFTECDYVNPHGTGTDNNETAENAVYNNTNQLRYKENYGHTQGVSGLLEVCMVMDNEDIKGKVLCVSSGLGGFYGSCILHM
jgi:hypothetical protein